MHGLCRQEFYKCSPDPVPHSCPWWQGQWLAGGDRLQRPTPRRATWGGGSQLHQSPPPPSSRSLLNLACKAQDPASWGRIQTAWGSVGDVTLRIQLLPPRDEQSLTVPSPRFSQAWRVKPDPRIPQNLRPAEITWPHTPPSGMGAGGWERGCNLPKSHEGSSQAWTHFKPPLSTPQRPRKLQVCSHLLSGMPDQAVLSCQRAFPEAPSGQGPILDAGNKEVKMKTPASWPKQPCHRRQPQASGQNWGQSSTEKEVTMRTVFLLVHQPPSVCPRGAFMAPAAQQPRREGPKPTLITQHSGLTLEGVPGMA